MMLRMHNAVCTFRHTEMKNAQEKSSRGRKVKLHSVLWPFDIGIQLLGAINISVLYQYTNFSYKIPNLRKGFTLFLQKLSSEVIRLLSMMKLQLLLKEGKCLPLKGAKMNKQNFDDFS